MNIVYHHRTQCKGVEGVHIMEIVKALTKLNNQVDIVSPTGIKTSDSSQNVLTVSKSTRWHSFLSKCLPEICFEFAEIIYNLSAKRKLEILLQEKKYDFIYERYAIFSWAGVKAAQKYKIPIILEVNYTSFTPLVRKRNMLLKPFAHWIDKKTFSSVDGFVAVSTHLKNHLIQLGINSERIIVLTNAADSDKFNSSLTGEVIRKRHSLGNKIIIGFVGGFYPWHGLDLLLDCFTELKHKVTDVCLLLIGDGPTKEKIRLRTRKLQLENDVLFIGKVPSEQLPEYIAAFDITVMPDSNDYGSPMKIFEYMSMSKPVIAPRLGPLEDGIKDGIEGILFEKGNKEALLQAIISLIENKQLRLDMGRAGRENVLKHHTWIKNTESILGLFEQIKKARLI